MTTNQNDWNKNENLPDHDPQPQQGQPEEQGWGNKEDKPNPNEDQNTGMPGRQPDEAMGGEPGSAQGNDLSKMNRDAIGDDENPDEESDPTGDRPRYGSDEDADDEDVNKGDVNYPGKD